MTFVPGIFTITTASDFFPVWRFRQIGKAGSYLWTSDPVENANIQANLKKSWQYEGVAFNINRANPLNVNTLWRFRNLKTGSYLYTADPAEKANIESDPLEDVEVRGTDLECVSDPDSHSGVALPLPEGLHLPVDHGSQREADHRDDAQEHLQA